MEKRYSFLDRITSDTPIFFKRVQLFGISLTSLGVALTQIHGMPVRLTTVMISVGSAITAIAQFAVKQYEPQDSKSDDEAK